MPEFTADEWARIENTFDDRAEQFGLPEVRDDSVVFATFNIRKLGSVARRPEAAWRLLTKIAERFDLLAVQEVMDDLEGFLHLDARLGDGYGHVVSDVTGVKPGERGNPERLGYFFRWARVERTAMASDITYDRSEIARNLYAHSTEFDAAWIAHARREGRYGEQLRLHEAGVRRSRPKKPAIALPRFVSFIRQPHYVSFRVPGANGADPYEFLAVNAHLLYGQDPRERQWEFQALIDWLTVRARRADRLYHPNLLLLGDCNLDFDDDVTVMRETIDAQIKSLNQRFLGGARAATANFPLLTPRNGVVLRTALRQQETYDQIGLFAHDARLPAPEANAAAGTEPGGFDYGVFNIAELLAEALHGEPLASLSAARRKHLYGCAQHDLSDHMPAWMRLPVPS